MVMNRQKEAFIELECAWILLHDLPRGLHELCEHWGHLLVVRSIQESTAIRELVTERQPFLLYQCLHTIKHWG